MSTFLVDLLKRLTLLIVLAAVGFGAWKAYERHRAVTGAESAMPAVPPVVPAIDRVSSRGRIEPRHGIRRISGPSSLTYTVVARLLVDEGDHVQAGQLLGVTDTHDVRRAIIEQREAQLANVRREYERSAALNREKLASESETELLQTRVVVAEAALKRARAEFELAEMRAPIDGTVLRIRARAGEAIGPAGLLELGDLEHMYVIAEIYETDVRRVQAGQRATVRSAALGDDLLGTVERVRMKVEKQDEIGTDPAARKDARIVEALIRLDDSTRAAAFTNLQVEVVIEA